MRINFLIKQIYITALLSFVLIPLTYAQESLQDEVQREKMLQDQASQSVAASEQRVQQQQQQVYNSIDQSYQNGLAQQQAIQENQQNQTKANMAEGGDMNPLFIPIILVGILIFWGTAKYNNLVQAKVAVSAALSQIDVLLKRRHDLIPNLVEATKGYMGYEKDTLEKVTKARQTAINAANVPDKSQAENILTTSLRGFYAVAENYPNLKADQNVLKLQSELSDTENKISFARQDYNNKVQALNVFIQSFPDSIVAAVGHFEKAPFFQGEKAEEDVQVPQVKL